MKGTVAPAWQSWLKYQDDTATISKVVTQFVQFLSDNRVGDSPMEDVNGIEAEDLEPAD